MRGWKLPLLIIAIAAVYSAGVLFYLSRMPSLFAVLYFFASAPFEQDSGFRQCLYGLKDMRLEPADAPARQRLTALGICFVVDTQEPIVPRENGEYRHAYLVGEGKVILLQTFEPYKESADSNMHIGDNALSYKYVYRDMKARMLFEKATGKIPDSEYICEEAFRDITIWDFSPFDDNKNMGVLTYLCQKSLMSQSVQKSYRFDNGKVICLLDQRDNAASLVFFSPEDLDTRYCISIVGSFTPSETETILRTLTLDQETLTDREVDIP